MIIHEQLSVPANVALDLVAERMATIELELAGCDPQERATRLSHMAADIQASHNRDGGEDTPDSIVRSSAVALLVAALTYSSGEVQ